MNVKRVGLVLAAVAILIGIEVTVTTITGRGTPRSFGTTSCANPYLSGAVVTVTLTDHGGGMMGSVPMTASLRSQPTTVRAGNVSFVARNQGSLAHELIVLPLSSAGPGARAVDANGKVDESQSLGEASRPCASGAGNGLPPGSTGWVTVALPAGRYELVCNDPLHYSAGMFDVLTVQ